MNTIGPVLFGLFLNAQTAPSNEPKLTDSCHCSQLTQGASILGGTAAVKKHLSHRVIIIIFACHRL